MLSISAASLFLAGVCLLAVRGTLPPAVAALYLGASLAAAIAYRIDKTAAQTDAWRTPEWALHVLALLGGWPGALIAQRVFHHKTRKLSFQVAFWTTVAVNCGVMAWLLVAAGYRVPFATRVEGASAPNSLAGNAGDRMVFITDQVST